MSNKLTKDARPISKREEFLYILIFTFVIPLSVTLIQIILEDIDSFLDVGVCFATNIVPSVIAYVGVIIIQDIIWLTKQGSALCRWTVIGVMGLTIYTILYAAFLVSDSLKVSDSIIKIFLYILIGLTILIVWISICSFFETLQEPVKRIKRKFSGRDY